MGLYEFSYEFLKSQEEEEKVEGLFDSNPNEQQDSESSLTAEEGPTWKAIANMTSMIQGSSALALPFAVMKGGIAIIIAFPLFALIHWYTGKVLIDCIYEEKEWDEDSESTPLQIDENKRTANTRKLRVRSVYGDLGKVIWPDHGTTLLDMLQILDLFIYAVEYFIGAGSLLAHSLPKIGFNEAMWASVIAVVVLPSTFVKDIACVAWQSLLGLASLITMASVLVWYTVTHSSGINFKNLLFWDTEGIFVGLGLVISSYCLFSILIPVEESMADRSKFGPALGVSLFSACIFKVLFSVIGFLSFLEETDEVIGNNFPNGAPRIIVSVVYSVFVVFTYSLVVYPMLQSIDESEFTENVTVFIPPLIWTATTRFLLVTGTFLISVAIPHFALLTGFIGSLVLPFLEYVVPCLVHLKLKWSGLKTLQILADGAIILLAGFATILCTFSTGKALVIAMIEQ